MMTSFNRWAAALSVVLLAACGGGGGDPGSPPFGGGPGAGAKAADLSLVLSAPTLNNSGSETVTATVTAVDANRNAIGGIAVTLSVDQDATALVSGSTTDASGVVTGVIGIGAVSTNRVVTVRAVSGELTRTATLRVVGTKLTGTPLPAVLSPSTAGKVQYKLVNANSIPMADVAVVITGPDGVQTEARTGLNGDYEFSYIAPAAAGTLSVRASAGGVENVQSITVQAGPGAIPNATAGSVRSASVRANPSVVPVNLDGQTTNQAEVRALFLGDANAPVKNIRVRFDHGGDAASLLLGGTFTTNPNLVYSDASGVAVSAYVPGSRFSPTNGVVIRACWDYADFAPDACPNPTSAKTTLTIISDALSVSIGTDNKILLGESRLTYVKRYVVQVNDSSGLAKSDVLVSPLVDLTHYRKGQWTGLGEVWAKAVTAICLNEDINRNGIDEDHSSGGGEGVEDANGTFNSPLGRPALDPPKATVAVSFESASRTNSLGQVIVRLEYPQSSASWIDFNLIVAAAGVAGTEGRANYYGTLPVLADDISDLKVSPPFQVSPFGIGGSGVLMPVRIPGAPATETKFLCTNKD